MKWVDIYSATRNTMEISYAISTFYVQACELFVSRRYHRIRRYLHNISVNTLWQQINNTHLKQFSFHKSYCKQPDKIFPSSRVSFLIQSFSIILWNSTVTYITVYILIQFLQLFYNCTQFFNTLCTQLIKYSSVKYSFRITDI